MDWKAICFYFCNVLLICGTVFGKEVSTNPSNTALAMRKNFLSHGNELIWSNSNINRQLILTPECNGEENLLSDLAIISFMLSLISSTAGLFSLAGLSFPGYLLGIISMVISLVLWIPGAIFTFFAWSEPFFWLKGNLITHAGLFVTLYGGMGIISGTVDLVIGIIDEVLGITSVVLSALTTFPEAYDFSKEMAHEIFGRMAVDNFLRGYGCGQ